MRFGASAVVIASAPGLLAAPAHAQTGPTVTSSLPDRRAPGAPLTVRGTVSSTTPVELWIGAAKRTETTSEPAIAGVVSSRFLPARINWVQPRLKG